MLETPACPCVAVEGKPAAARSSAVSLLNAFPPQTVLLDQAQEHFLMHKYSISIFLTLPPYRQMQHGVIQHETASAVE